MSDQIEPVDEEYVEEARGDAAPDKGFRFSKTGWLGAAIVAFWILIAIFGPWIAPYTEAEFVSYDSFLPALDEFILGLAFALAVRRAPDPVHGLLCHTNRLWRWDNSRRICRGQGWPARSDHQPDQ